MQEPPFRQGSVQCGEGGLGSQHCSLPRHLGGKGVNLRAPPTSNSLFPAPQGYLGQEVEAKRCLELGGGIKTSKGVSFSPGGSGGTAAEAWFDCPIWITASPAGHRTPCAGLA